MANQRVIFTARLVDGDNVQTGVHNYLSLPDTATIAQLITAMGTWARDVDACLDGAFTQSYVLIAPSLPAGLKAATGATWTASRAEQTALLGLASASSGRRPGAVLPSFSSALISGGKISTGAAAFTTLISLLTSAVLGGVYTDKEGNDLVALLVAALSFRQYRQQLAALSIKR